MAGNAVCRNQLLRLLESPSRWPALEHFVALLGQFMHFQDEAAQFLSENR